METDNNYYYLSSSVYAYVDPPTSSDPTPTPPAFCGGNANPGVKTALGCIRYTDTNIFSSQLIRISAAVSGGIALLFISIAAFQIITSSGDPKKMTDARDMVTAAVTGILFITMSTLIMRILGINILGLF